jgi:hypothetical protein
MRSQRSSDFDEFLFVIWDALCSPCEHVFSAPYASKEQQWQQQHPSTQVSESVSVWFFNLHLILVTPH